MFILHAIFICIPSITWRVGGKCGVVRDLPSLCFSILEAKDEWPQGKTRYWVFTHVDTGGTVVNQHRGKHKGPFRTRIFIRFVHYYATRASGPGGGLRHNIQRAYEVLRKRCRAPRAYGLSSKKGYSLYYATRKAIQKIPLCFPSEEHRDRSPSWRTSVCILTLFVIPTTRFSSSRSCEYVHALQRKYPLWYTTVSSKSNSGHREKGPQLVAKHPPK